MSVRKHTTAPRGAPPVVGGEAVVEAEVRGFKPTGVLHIFHGTLFEMCAHNGQADEYCGIRGDKVLICRECLDTYVNG